MKLIDVTNDSWYTIATASVAEDGNPVTITCSVGDGGSVPNFSDREQTYNIIAQTTADADTSWRDGLLAGSVTRHNVGLHPGEKMVCTTPDSWVNHYMGWDYTGASIGQSNPYNEQTGAIQIAATEKLIEKTGFSINTKAERYDTGTSTDVMGEAQISWRYHLDYSMDLFDEDK